MQDFRDEILIDIQKKQTEMLERLVRLETQIKIVSAFFGTIGGVVMIIVKGFFG